MSPAKVVKSNSIRRIAWWLGVMSILCFLAAVWVISSYQNIYWQFMDGLWINMVLGIRTEQLTGLMIGITNFGYYGTLMIWLMILGMVAVKRDVQTMGLVAVMAGGGWGLGMLVKDLVSRIRPEGIALVMENSFSLPSLHSLTAMVLYLTLPYLVYYFSRRFFWSYLVFVVGLLMALAIGFSRIYLGVHYFSDVMAGFILGAGWFLGILCVEKCICLVSKCPNRSV